ncbi:MAG: O-antigen ligase family protein [Patescibacteria group bacterium]|nr:O-antigen ligase family protein [Patescibacteria group bacterium]
MSLLLAFIFLGIFVYLSWRNLVWGAGLTIAFLPAYLWRLEIFSLPTTFLELMILSLFVIFLLKDGRWQSINFSLQSNQRNLLSKPWRFLLLLWLLASVLALVVNPSYGALGLWRAYFLEPMMFFIVLLYSVRSRADLKIIIAAGGFLIFWLFGATLYQKFFQWNYLPNWPGRMSAVFPYPNALGLLAAPWAGFFSVFWLYQKKSRYSYLFIILFFLAVVLVFLAKSKGAMLAIVIFLFFYLILAKKVRKWGQPVALLFILAAFLFFNAGTYLKKSLLELGSPQIDLSASSLEIRSDQWQETFAMLKDNFWLGAGLDGYQAAMRPYHQTPWLEIYLYPHNIFLNFWSELGFFGLLVFLCMVFYISHFLYLLLKEKNPLAWPLLLSWLIWFGHGLADVPYFKNDLSILFFLLLFLTLWAKDNREEAAIF